jgi:hypothetical protein
VLGGAGKGKGKNAAGRLGSEGHVAGIFGGPTTTTNPKVALDRELQHAASSQPTHDHQPFVFLVLGIIAAAVFWVATRTRRAVT